MLKVLPKKCQNDNTCVAYEWQNGQAVYYKNMTIGNSCKSYYSNGAHKDTLPVIKKLIFKKGARNPVNTDIANAWLNTSDGSFWVNSDPNVLNTLVEDMVDYLIKQDILMLLVEFM